MRRKDQLNPTPKEELPPDEGILQPDYQSLHFGKSDVPITASPAEMIALAKETYAQYRAANWFYWPKETWEKYLEQNAQQRQRLGDAYEPQAYEQALIEYAKWRIENMDEDDYQCFFELFKFTDDYLYVVFTTKQPAALFKILMDEAY